MKLFSTYKVKIKESNGCFYDTAELYRKAVDFFIDVILKKWDDISKIETELSRMMEIEAMTISTKTHPNPNYLFTERKEFWKFPSYLRRAAIAKALGKVSSYKSCYENWEKTKTGKSPGYPKAGYTYPAMYRDNCFVKTGTYTAELKVWIRNTWDWISIDLRKSDVDYILKHCKSRKECVPTLRRRGKNWYLDFAFEEKVKLDDKKVKDQIVIGVDLGINSACVCSAMLSDGTVIGRKFLKLSREEDSLKHSLNKIKKAQQHGNRKTPRLWAKAKGINSDISVKTAEFIIKFAELYSADIIVFEHLDRNGKKKGFKKRRLHHWKSCDVQRIVADKAHRDGIRIRHVCAWNTSKYAFDGSGVVERDKSNYSICTFSNGKRYNCDLSASYNIAARYFVREIWNKLTERNREKILLKVPEAGKATQRTLSTLKKLVA